jgi:hypothetical protein
MAGSDTQLKKTQKKIKTEKPLWPNCTVITSNRKRQQPVVTSLFLFQPKHEHAGHCRQLISTLMSMYFQRIIQTLPISLARSTLYHH